MADTKVSALTNVTSLNGADEFHVVQSGTSKAADINDVLNLVDASFGVEVIPDGTAVTTGTAKVTFHIPYAMTLTDVKAGLTSVGSTSGTTTIDINEGGTTILSTKLTIDYGEDHSSTAATAAVISDSTLAADAKITIDVDAVTGGADEEGLKVYFIGTRVAV